MADETKMQPPELPLDKDIAKKFIANKHDQDALHDLGSLMPIPWGGELLKSLLSLTLMVLHWISLPVEMMIRKDFGIRYISIIRYFAAATFTGLSQMVLGLFFGFGWMGFVFSWMVTLVFFWHFWQTRQNSTGARYGTR